MKVWMSIVAMVCSSTLVWAADPVIGPGKAVKVDYTLTVDNEQIETSVGKEPLQFTVGSNTIIPGLESQLTGMHEGEEKVITVAPADAYGVSDPQAIKEFPKTSMPQGADPKPGMVLQAKAPDGEEFPAVVKEVKGDNVVLDFNHPLAGKTLSFKVKVLSITDAPAVPAVKPAAPAAAEVPVAK